MTAIGPSESGFWLATLPAQGTHPLTATHDTDIAIIGGGFTGLWTALHLKAADPSLRITVLERSRIGAGASGRNGGFAMTMLARNLHDLLRKVGVERARVLHHAMQRSLDAIAALAEHDPVGVDISRPGLLTVSTHPDHDARIRRDLAAAARLGVTDTHFLDAAGCRELLDSPTFRCGHFEAQALLVNPAQLARALERAARAAGVEIFDATHAETVSPTADGATVYTQAGSVRASRVLLATNAWSHAIPRLRRVAFTVHAHVTLTEALSDAQWERIGWATRMGVEDRRIMPHFFRPTADGRILWGGRDAPLRADGADATCTPDPRIIGRLHETFRQTFPQLADVRFEHGWSGPVCATVRCLPTCNWLDHQRHIAYAFGYSGHGVGPSHLLGNIAADLLLDRATPLLDLPPHTMRPLPLPTGRTLRSLVFNAAQRTVLRADDEGADASLLTRIAATALN